MRNCGHVVNFSLYVIYLTVFHKYEYMPISAIWGRKWSPFPFGEFVVLPISYTYLYVFRLWHVCQDKSGNLACSHQKCRGTQHSLLSVSYVQHSIIPIYNLKYRGSYHFCASVVISVSQRKGLFTPKTRVSLLSFWAGIMELLTTVA